MLLHDNICEFFFFKTFIPKKIQQSFQKISAVVNLFFIFIFFSEK